LMIGSVEGAENRVTLLAENQPLGEVLQSIQKASGVAVVLADKKWTNDPVTCSVKNLELEKALGVVFGGYNYVLAFEADKGDVSKILVTVYEKKEGVAMPTGSATVQVAGSQPPRMSSGLMSRDLDAYAETYHKIVVAEQKPTVYPEGVTQRDIERTRQELVN